MPSYAALDIAQETTAICGVDDEGRIRTEKKVPTCPIAISDILANGAPGLVRVGIETGPLAVWLWTELAERKVPIICMDARHANAALKMRPVKTDWNDAAGLAQIVRTGGFTQRADEIIEGEFEASPDMRLVAEVLMKARASPRSWTRSRCSTGACPPLPGQCRWYACS